ncbi:MAG: glycosyltransferase family 2 protein [Capsulimonadaceae bacterium]
MTVSIVYSGKTDMMRDCLRSLFDSTSVLAIDVWIIDNTVGCGRGRAELQEEYSQVHWIVNTEVKGFSENHNQVLRIAHGRHACILNDDTLIHSGAIDRLIAYLDEHPDVGMVGPRLLNTDGTQQNCTFKHLTVMSEFLGILFLPGPLNDWKTIGIDPAQRSETPQAVDWVLGACIIVRGSTLAQIGYLDSDLSPVVNTEEEDWCYRATEAGWKVVHVPSAVLTHHGGQTIGAMKVGRDAIRIELYRTRIAFVRKHYGVGKAALLRFVYVVTFPWNAAMLTQSVLRRRLTGVQYRSYLATLCGTAMMSLFHVRECAIPGRSRRKSA